MTPADKVRENRLRRMAQRQGLVLRKSRTRDWMALDYGLYWLIGTANNPGTDERGRTLDEVEQFLNTPREERSHDPDPARP